MEPCEICVILDRSGSMMSRRDDHIGGLRSFVDDQKKAAGDANFTLIQFDSVNACEVMYDGVPIQKVDHIELTPRGNTPLLDAIGMGCAHVEKRIGRDYKGQVVYMIVTDGGENCSREWTKEKVKELVADLEKRDRKVLFLGCGIDAFGEASCFGLTGQTVSNVSNTSVGTQTMYRTTSRKLSGARGMSASAWNPVTNDRNQNVFSAANDLLNYTPAEQAEMENATDDPATNDPKTAVP